MIKPNEGWKATLIVNFPDGEGERVPDVCGYRIEQGAALIAYKKAGEYHDPKPIGGWSLANVQSWYYQ